MAKIERFEDLECWKAARTLVNFVFQICQHEKLSRDFATRDQIKRASLSTMNNIAEGFGRMSNKEFVRYLEIAQASAQEVRSMSYVLNDNDYLDAVSAEELREFTNAVINLVHGLIRYLVNKNK